MNRQERKVQEKVRRKEAWAEEKNAIPKRRSDHKEGQLRLHRYVIERAAFDALPENERVFLVLAGQLANELNALTQLGLWSRIGTDPVPWTTDTPDQVARFARFSQAFYLLRLVILRLWKGWQTLRVAFFCSGVFRTYEPLLHSTASDALATLTKIFGGSTPLITVRNEFSGHSDPGAIRAVLSELAADDQLDVFIAAYSTYSNCFSPLSERVTEAALLRRLPGFETPQAAVAELLDQTNKATQAFQAFLWGCITIALERHRGRWRGEEMILTDVPKLLDIQVPFFSLDPLAEEIHK
jgi:hypothetical protein